MQLTYNIETHKHNFAVWTAARAVQRNFTNSKTIATAIQKSQLHSKVRELEMKNISEADFDIWHRDIAKEILKAIPIKEKDIREPYGRAAKIIAIYIKTYHILGNPNSSLSSVAHPPVDRILLSGLFKKNKEFTKLDVSDTAWTNLTENAYFEVINELRIIQKKMEYEYFWMIESDWKSA